MNRKRILHHMKKKPKLIILDESGKVLDRSTISKEQYDYIKKQSERFGSIEAYIISLIKEHQKLINSPSN